MTASSLLIRLLPHTSCWPGTSPSGVQRLQRLLSLTLGSRKQSQAQRPPGGLRTGWKLLPAS